MPGVTPFLNGDSYIIIDKKSVLSKKRQLAIGNKTADDYIRIKFSTTKENGLLLWNTKVSPKLLKLVCVSRKASSEG